MSENKITEEQLEELQGYVGKLNNAANQIGNLELQKHEINHAAAEVRNDLNKFQQKLKEKYGDIRVNLQDGSFKLVEQEEQVVGPEVLKK